QDFENFFHVMAIDYFRSPTERVESFLIHFQLVAECGGLALAQPIDIDDGDQIVQLINARQGSGFPDAAFRALAVTQQDVSAKIQAVEARTESHADSNTQSLPQGTRRHIDEWEPRRWMTFEIIPPFAQLVQFADRNHTVFRPRGIEQRCRMSFRED